LEPELFIKCGPLGSGDSIIDVAYVSASVAGIGTRLSFLDLSESKVSLENLDGDKRLASLTG